MTEAGRLSLVIPTTKSEILAQKYQINQIKRPSIKSKQSQSDPNKYDQTQTKSIESKQNQ